MDRSLVAGAVLLLIIEVSCLLIGLDDVPSWRTGSSSSASQGRLLGHVKRTESHVRRRARSSLVWEESQAPDPLYEFDSLLTLAGSTAQIQFASQTSLTIDENTLIVLEETPDQANGSLRVRFSRGSIRSRNPTRPLAIEGESFTITATQGSVVNLVSLKDGRFDVEVSEGKAKLNSAKASEEIKSGERLVIRDAKIEDRKRVDQDLPWEAVPARLYARLYPIETELKWRGVADKIRLIAPDKTEQIVKLDSSTTSHRLRLGEGTYQVSLENGERVSSTRTIQVRQSPSFRYFSPLPRNRVRSSGETIFAWETNAFATRYRLEMSSTSDFSSDVKSWTLDSPRFSTQLADEGAYFWRVIGVDETGTSIPEPRSYPLYVAPDPLSSPELHAPQIRQPASPKKNDEKAPAPRKGSLFWLLLPESAHASEDVPLEALFSWSPVPDADHYIIEISATPGFESPVVIKRVSKPEFGWRGFEKGTYFWRVAAGRSKAGANGDRLGLFSPLAVARLEDTDGFAGPGVTVNEAPPSEEPKSVFTKPPPLVSKAEPEPPPMPEDIGPAVKSPPPAQEMGSPASPPAPPIEAMDSDHPSRGRWHKRLAWQPGYRMGAAEGAQGIQGSFTGPTLLALRTEVHYQSANSYPWELHLAYDEAEWKPKDRAQTPFQQTLREQRMALDLFTTRDWQNWSFAFGAEILPLFKRKANEEGELANAILLGPSGRFLKPMSERLHFETLIHFRFGEVIGARAKLGLRYQLHKGERATYSVSPSIGYGQFQGTESKLRDLQSAIEFAMDW